jgi:hypothetical protein
VKGTLAGIFLINAPPDTRRAGSRQNQPAVHGRASPKTRRSEG